MIYVVSGSWTPKQCQAWLSSHGVGFKFNHIVIGDFHILLPLLHRHYHVCQSPLLTKGLAAGLVFSCLLCGTQNAFRYREHWLVDMKSLLNTLEKFPHEAHIHSLSSLTGLPCVGFCFGKISNIDKPLARLTKRWREKFQRS